MLKNRSLCLKRKCRILMIGFDDMMILEKCIIEVLYQTGMRKAELCGLIFENVDLDENELKNRKRE
jgi:integrase